MRVPLDAHELRDLHRAELRHPAHVVPTEVDEHHVLGALLVVAEQLLLEYLVRHARVPAGARARDRAQLDAVAGLAHEHLRRRAHEVPGPELQVEHVGGRIDDAERAVEVEGIAAELLVEALREHDLDAVSGVDVLPWPSPPPPLKRTRLNELRNFAPARRGAFAGADPGRGATQLRDQLLDLPLALAVGLLRIAARGLARDDLHREREVVEDDDRVGQQEDRVRYGEIVVGGVRELLQVADGVVRQEADRAAPERGQVVDRDGFLRPVPPLQLDEAGRRPPATFRVFPLALDRDLAVARRVDRGRVRPENRVPGPLLAALDALEKERVLAVRDLEERRDRSVPCRRGSRGPAVPAGPASRASCTPAIPAGSSLFLEDPPDRGAPEGGAGS